MIKIQQLYRNYGYGRQYLTKNRIFIIKNDFIKVNEVNHYFGLHKI